MSDEHHGGGDMKFLVGLFLGGIIGALIIFFLGTKEGKKASKVLEEKGKDLVGDLSDQIGDLEKKGKDLVKQGEEIKKEVAETLTEEKEVLTEQATEKLDTALAHIEELQAQGQQTTAELRKRLFRNLPKKR